MTIKLAKHQVHDFTIPESGIQGNPYAVDFLADFTHSSGRKVLGIPGFYDGGSNWKIRFSPPLEGSWHGVTRSDASAFSGRELEEVACVSAAPSLRGGLRVDSANGHRFCWDDGTPFIPLGFECDWLFSYHQRNAERCRRDVERIASRGFNYVVMNLYAHTGFGLPGDRDDDRPVLAEHVYGPPDMYPFGGTNDEPDHEVMNPEFFRDLDRLMALLQDCGVVAHLMLQVQNKNVSWPARGSREDEMFWRYAVARYQAFQNLVWDVCKESWRLERRSGSHDYALGRIAAIRSHDAYGHLVTVHDPAIHSQSNCVVDEACDFVSDQVHLGDARAYNRDAIERQENGNVPYLNIEYGYELGADAIKTYTGGTTARWQDVLDWTWSLYAAGAFANYYYDNTSWDLIKFEPEPPGWARYALLRDVLDHVPFRTMKADNALVDRGFCLADPGRAYMVYLRDGGDVCVDLSAAAQAAGRIRAEWLDTWTGQKVESVVKNVSAGTLLRNSLAEPGHPCVIVVRC